MEPIAHFDADAFFASVEQAADSRLRRRPVAVGGQRGVICSASYEARTFGVRGAMPTRKALEVCPDLILIRGQFELYEQFSEHLFGLCESLTPYVERASIDEGYIDFRGQSGGLPQAVKRLRGLEEAVGSILKISLSCGLSARKRVAEIAAKVNKPHGFTVIPRGNESAFLAPLGLAHLPGLGPKRCQRLGEIGLRTIGDLARTPVDLLYPFLGRGASGFVELAKGEDDSRVCTEGAAPASYGGQKTMDETGDEAAVYRLSMELLGEQMTRLRKARQCARRLTIGVRYVDYVSSQASKSLLEPSALDSAFIPYLRILLRQAWSRRVRLNQIRVQVDRLYPDWEQGDLFSGRTERQRQLYAVHDALNARFGKGALGPASQLL